MKLLWQRDLFLTDKVYLLNLHSENQTTNNLMCIVMTQLILGEQWHIIEDINEGETDNWTGSG